MPIFLMLFVSVFGLITAVMILLYRNRSGFGTKLTYAAFAFLAPFLLAFPAAWLVPKGAPSWLDNTVLITIAISPYLVRALYVFKHPEVKDVQSTS
ncbi:hypothetical protein [uncultured Neptuniibacter sp.]|uniref:hypothetical protein n=1 Tax=uncultured Neptuniibacter sp. TaxID=502143 RepID=UPI0026016B7E|nr:hypothetical protein [uncultured Neptuniibacter sp.]